MALLQPQVPCPAGLRAWNGSDPAVRLDVHRNNVVSSLIDALADTFPVVQALVGEEFFRATAGVFVRQHPPRSRVLAEYGHGFGDFIEDFHPAAGLPYLADVARLEMARLAATHAADAVPLAPEDARHALDCGERVANARIDLHPSLRLVPSDFAVVSLWAAHQGHGDLAQVDPSLAETALVLRPALETLVLRCDRGTAEFVLGLQCGGDLAQSAGRAAATGREFDLAATLALLLGHGAFTSIVVP
jgi:hypothetical protein